MQEGEVVILGREITFEKITSGSVSAVFA